MRFSFTLSVLAVLSAAGTARALDSSNVLVLYNAGSPEGAQIADYYAAIHPGVRMLGLTGITSAEEVSADYYLSALRPQILPALDASVDVIVTTKGLPLRINTAPHANPGTYTDPYGTSRTIYSSTWKPYSSLESELTRIDTVSTWQQMGDQTYWNPLNSPLSSNPYYSQQKSFSHSAYGTRLTSRLDAFSVSDVKASIDRAQQAQAGKFAYVLDDDPSKSYDLMPSLANNVLAPLAQNYVYDNTDTFVNSAAAPVIGYVSHGRHQSSTPANYILDPQAGIKFDLAPGAVFASWESYNAYSFVPGGNRSGQGLIAEWLARGGTAGVGNVEEPKASAATITNEDLLFRGLLSGQTWAEAAWSATAQLSYVNTVVGDPLMRLLVVGDLDGNQIVDNFDVSAFELALTNPAAYLDAFPGLTDFRLRADVNHDGSVNNFDIQGFQALLVGPGSTHTQAVPEPCTITQLCFAAYILTGFYRRSLVHRAASSA